MEIVSHQREVTSGGMKASTAFTIKGDAHVMAILSSLYKHPEEALVREYMTNMNDANIALLRVNPKAKIRSPVIRVPSRLSPTLEFQDFGIGMDYDMVWQVYTQYGNSTKNGNNEEVGGFGLGSKTAFAYNNGAPWNIIATKDGVTNYFMCFVGENGIPQMTHIETKREGLPSGVTVSIPIKHNDISKITEAVKKFVPYFPTDILVTGGITNAEIAVKEYDFTGATWKVKAGERGYGYNTSLTVVIGNVPYEVDTVENDAQGYNKPSWLKGELYTHNSWTVHLPIGSVDIVPSRDDLKYTDRTKKAIETAMNKCGKELAEVIATSVTGAKTEWEALVMFNKATKKLVGSDVLKLHNVLKWNGVLLVEGDKVVRTLTQVRASLGKNITVTEFAITSSNLATPRVKEITEINVRVPDDAHAAPNSYIVIEDLPKGGISLSRGLVRQKFVKVSFGGRVAKYGHTLGRVFLLNELLTKKEVSEFFGGIPEANILFASELKGVVPTIKGESLANIYRWDGIRNFASRVKIPATETAYYYLPMTRLDNGRFGYAPAGAGIHSNSEQTMRHLTDLMELLEIEIPQSTATIPYPIIYGVLDTDVSKLTTDWTNLADMVTEKLIEKAKSQMSLLALSSGNVEDMSSTLEYKFVTDIASSQFPEAKVIADAGMEIETAHKKVQPLLYFLRDNQAVLDTANSLLTAELAKTIKDEGKKVKKNLTKDAKEFIEQYPVLKMMFTMWKSTQNYYYGADRSKDSKKILKENLQLVLDNKR